MIEKQDFYHGAALIQLLDHKSFKKIAKFEPGYLINDQIWILMKYTTKNRSPWRFTFSQDDVLRLRNARKDKSVFVTLICGGDGVCSLSLEQFNSLLVNSTGWISISRKFRKQYSAAGPDGDLDYKISLRGWPSNIF
jgi:hypothetical protein